MASVQVLEVRRWSFVRSIARSVGRSVGCSVVFPLGQAVRLVGRSIDPSMVSSVGRSALFSFAGRSSSRPPSRSINLSANWFGLSVSPRGLSVRSIHQSSDCASVAPFDRSDARSVGRSIDPSIGRVCGASVYRSLIDLCVWAGRSVARSIGRSFGSLPGRSAGWLIVRRVVRSVSPPVRSVSLSSTWSRVWTVGHSIGGSIYR